jgi:hypothetical protein
LDPGKPTGGAGSQASGFRRARPWLLALVILGAVGISTERGLSREPDGCASCHAMRRYVDAFKTGRDLDAAHARAGLVCTDCHQGYSLSARAKSAAAYSVGMAGTPARRRYDDAMCNRCHVSMEHLGERTDFLLRNPHRSHWPELGCADCHLGHAKQIDFCNGCHDNGGQRMTGEAVRTPRAPNPWFWFQGECRPAASP